jgi:hypothetical protein
MIQTRCSAEETKAKVTEKPEVQCITHSRDEEHGDLLIRGFWAGRTDVIVNVQVMDTDAKSYRSHDPHKVLAHQEKEEVPDRLS